MKMNNDLFDRVLLALEDAMLLYSPDLTTLEQKRSVLKRVGTGGALAYFADLRIELQACLAADEKELRAAFDNDFTSNYLAHMRDEFACEGREIEEIMYMAFCRGHKHSGDR